MSDSSEKLLPTVLFVITLVLVTAMLITLLGDMVNHNQQNIRGPALSTPQQLLLENYELFPYSPTIVAVNGTTLGGNHSWQQITFTSAGHTSVGCVIVRNLSSSVYYWMGVSLTVLPAWPGHPSDSAMLQAISQIPNDNDGWKPTDFVMFWQAWQGGTLDMQHFIKYNAISFEDISASAHQASSIYQVNPNGVTNVSQMSFVLRYWITSFISWDMGAGGSLLSRNTNLWNNQFNISVGGGLNSTLSHPNPWTLLAEMATLKFDPGLPTIIRYLMAVPIWLAIGFAIIMIIIRAFKP